jgi:hypothetical protein
MRNYSASLTLNAHPADVPTAGGKSWRVSETIPARRCRGTVAARAPERSRYSDLKEAVVEPSSYVFSIRVRVEAAGKWEKVLPVGVCSGCRIESK